MDKVVCLARQIETFDMLIDLSLAGLCLYLSCVDLLHRRIPNRVLLAGFLLLTSFGLVFCQDWPWLAHLSSGFVYLVLFGVIAWIWPAAIGMGDVKLIALLGYAMGFRPLVFVLTMACLAALLVALLLVLSKRATPGCTVPFAPFLTVGLLLFILLF